MVVEEHLLDTGIERDLLELTQSRGLRGLDDDQPPDRVELEAAGVDDGTELVGVQAVEVADVPVQRADRDDGGRVQATGSEHRTECVEVGVSMRGDDLFGPHGLIVQWSAARPPAADGQTCAIASISTRAPLGSCEMPIVERAGGRSPT